MITDSCTYLLLPIYTKGVLSPEEVSLGSPPSIKALIKHISLYADHFDNVVVVDTDNEVMLSSSFKGYSPVRDHYTGTQASHFYTVHWYK